MTEPSGTEVPTVPTKPAPWWTRFTTLEPATLHAIIAALIIVLGTVGLDFTTVGDKIETAWGAIFAIIPLLQGLWTRSKVTPTAAVVEAAKVDGTVVAGPANDVVDTGNVVRLTTTPPATVPAAA